MENFTGRMEKNTGTLVSDVPEEQGICYARTTSTTFCFAIQSDLLHFQQTCHLKDAQLMVPTFLCVWFSVQVHGLTLAIQKWSSSLAY